MALNVVFSPVTLKRLVDEVGAMNIGAEMDPSHLMWQGMDVIESIKWLGPLVFHAAAKDATLCPGADIRGVLDTSFTRVPAEADGKVPTGYGFWCNCWPESPAWKRRRRPRQRRPVLDRVPARPRGRRPGHGREHRARGRGLLPDGGPRPGRQEPAQRGDGPLTDPAPLAR